MHPDGSVRKSYADRDNETRASESTRRFGHSGAFIPGTMLAAPETPEEVEAIRMINATFPGHLTISAPQLVDFLVTLMTSGALGPMAEGTFGQAHGAGALCLDCGHRGSDTFGSGSLNCPACGSVRYFNIG